MRLDRVEAIARAVLYEGYNLYPYRPSAIKNRQRWTFGSVFPRDWAARDGSDSGSMQTQCLLRGGPDAILDVRIRFLHIVAREIGELPEPIAELPRDGEPRSRRVATLEVDGVQLVEWEEAREREIAVPPLAIGRLVAAPAAVPFTFAAERGLEPVRAADGRIVALLIRTANALAGEIAVAAEPLADGVHKVTVRIENVTPLAPTVVDRTSAQRSAFASTHTVLGVRKGAFVSSLDPPAELGEAAARCKNQGAWPVLVGEVGQTDTLLSSPIILYDYPQIAPESPGDLFDGTEIDEILILRILTLTEDEKREMAAADPRTRALLERTEALSADDLARLHGAFRDPQNGAPVPRPASAAASIDGPQLKVGDRVRLRPKPGGDMMDIVLKDQLAEITAIERDFEDRIHVAVTIEDDPGRDLGDARMPGHRFFFAPDEIEPVDPGAAK